MKRVACLLLCIFVAGSALPARAPTRGEDPDERRQRVAHKEEILHGGGVVHQLNGVFPGRDSQRCENEAPAEHLLRLPVQRRPPASSPPVRDEEIAGRRRVH